MKTRVQVTINEQLLEDARRLMKLRRFDTVSEFLEVLIREDWERRRAQDPATAILMNDADPTPSKAPEIVAKARALAKTHTAAQSETPAARTAKRTDRTGKD